MSPTRILTALVVFAGWTVPATAAGQTDSGGWPLGEPDLVVEMPAAYPLAPGDGVISRNFVLPIGELPGDRWVRAFDLQPAANARGVVQRARILLDATGAGRILEAADDNVGYEGSIYDHGVLPAGHVLAWSATRSVVTPVDGVAWPLIPGTDLLLQLVMQADGSAVDVQASVGLYFAEGAPALTAVTLPMESPALDIPAGSAEHVVEDRYRLPASVDLIGAYPQMGPLGRQIHLAATLPDGTATELLRIDDWQPDEVVGHRYAQPIHLPAETMLLARFTFDNSTSNPRNPSNPPQRAGFVTADPAATSPPERGGLVLQVLPILAADMEALARNIALKRARNDMLSLQARLRFAPGDYRGHNMLAARYLDMGQGELARTHLEEALKLEPNNAETHFNLGSLLIAERNAAGAIDAFRKATELRPEYADAHNNLGALLASTGALPDAVVYYRLALQFNPRDASAHFNLGSALLLLRSREEALGHFREAVELAPNDPAVHGSLARALATGGDFGEAVTHYEQALELAPDYPIALVGLAWIRATSPYESLRQADQALALAQRAVAQIGNNHPEVLDTLAAAYAARGRFDDAVSTARRASVAAQSNPAYAALGINIEARIRLYLAFRPFRVPFPEQP